MSNKSKVEWHALTTITERLELNLKKSKLVRNTYRYLIKKHISSQQTFLDFGCAKCPFFNMLESKGIKFTGVGVDVKKVTEKFPVYPDVNNVPKGMKFDLCIMHHIIEHMSYEDALKNVKKISGRIKKGGLIAITTPNTFSLRGVMGFLTDVTHIKPYSLSLLAFILNQIDFDVIDYKRVHHFHNMRDAIRYPFRRFFTFLLGWDFESDSILVIGKKR